MVDITWSPSDSVPGGSPHPHPHPHGKMYPGLPERSWVTPPPRRVTINPVRCKDVELSVREGIYAMSARPEACQGTIILQRLVHRAKNKSFIFSSMVSCTDKLRRQELRLLFTRRNPRRTALNSSSISDFLSSTGWPTSSFY